MAGGARSIIGEKLMPHIEDDTLDLVIASLAELRELLVEVQAANRESEQVLTELEADANLKRIRRSPIATGSRCGPATARVRGIAGYSRNYKSILISSYAIPTPMSGIVSAHLLRSRIISPGIMCRR